MFKIAIIVLLCFSPTYSQDNTNDDFFINGFSFDKENSNYNKGIRLQGIGDYFFKGKSYVNAVPYYEQALTFLPSEADITFNLAEIYKNEELWRLAMLYYEQTIELLQLPVNFGKSQLNVYISRIKMAQIHHLKGESDKARKLVTEIRKESSLLESSYPKAYKALSFFDDFYPAMAVRKSLREE